MPEGQERQLPPVEFKRWTGMVTNANPHQMPNGAARNMVNLSLSLDGTLSVRQGIRELSFEN